MKAVVWENKDVINLREVPVPVPEKGDALIKVIMTGICGSDLTIISGKHPRLKPLR